MEKSRRTPPATFHNRHGSRPKHVPTRRTVRSALLLFTALSAQVASGAQTGVQTGVQTGAQTTAQTGTSTTIQTGTLPSPQILPSQPTYDPLGPQRPTIITPLLQPTLTPELLTLFELEGRFAQAVAKGGGKAFAEWFADDAVTLNNGRPAVLGRTAISREAQWKSAEYQLSWVPEGAQMGPSNDMGFTWGHYEGRSKDHAGQPVVTSGRYITLWKKQRGQWKVAMDASADEPPAAGICCSLPKP